MKCLVPATLAIMVTALAVTREDEGEPVRISGQTRYPPHSLVRLKADNVNPKAAIVWRVYPGESVQRATSPRGILEFAAPPGTYRVELLVIRQSNDNLLVDEATTTVTIESCHTPPPPSPPKPDPANALLKVQFGGAGCTATIVGPRRSDGRWDVLTAAHCVAGVGARGRGWLKDGREFKLTVVVHQRDPDLAWCVTDETPESVPFALLADGNPPIGTKVWHAGYGIDKPGNREDGEVTGNEDANGQLRMSLSVSSGDSGGGIFRSDTNELVSCVCCTSGMARKVSMWGASTRAIRAARPQMKAEHDTSWTPLPIPIRSESSGASWTPLPIPIRESSGASWRSVVPMLRLYSQRYAH